MNVGIQAIIPPEIDWSTSRIGVYFCGHEVETQEHLFFKYLPVDELYRGGFEDNYICGRRCPPTG